MSATNTSRGYCSLVWSELKTLIKIDLNDEWLKIDCKQLYKGRKFSNARTPLTAPPSCHPVSNRRSRETGEPQHGNMAALVRASPVVKVFMSLADHLNLYSNHHLPRRTVYNETVVLMACTEHAQNPLIYSDSVLILMTEPWDWDLTPNLGVTRKVLLTYPTNNTKTMELIQRKPPHTCS